MFTMAGWCFLFSIAAVRFTRMDAFNTFTGAAYIILMFLSSMFYPLNHLPQWFRLMTWLNPMMAGRRTALHAARSVEQLIAQDKTPGLAPGSPQP
jgi:hypothetical protein